MGFIKERTVNKFLRIWFIQLIYTLIYFNSQ